MSSQLARIGLAVVAVAVLTQCSTTVDGTARTAALSSTPEATSSTTRTTTSTAPTTSTTAATTTPGSGGSIDRAAIEAWLGEWAGDVEQADTLPYPVRITLEHDGHTVVGTSEYLSIGCTGRLDDADLDDGVLEIEETIPPEQLDKCFSTELELTLKPGEILYHFDAGGGGDAILRRP